jgi:DNA-binding transcriptional regulator YiaG
METAVDTYRSDVMVSIHETAEGLNAVGVMDKQTMRKFDEACLAPVRLPPRDGCTPRG